MGTSVEEDPKQKSQAQLVKLNKALKLAEQWVNNMSKSSTEEKLTSVELEGRPSGLGIGATVAKESRVTHLNNPVKRKLFSKLHINKRKSIKRDAESASTANNGKVDDINDEEEPESKTRAFSKKRLTSPLNAKRKHR